jgi:hypothetical protein
MNEPKKAPLAVVLLDVELEKQELAAFAATLLR